MNGYVKTVVIERGFGFLAVPGGEDVFFHMSQLAGLEWDERLTQRRVEFELQTQTDGRQRAINVRAEGY